MEHFNKANMARIHSFETMGTVDGPRASFCCLFSRVSSSLPILP